MTTSSLSICLVQFDIAWENPLENIRRVEELLHSREECDLLLLPEMWSTGFSMKPEKVAESSDGPALKWMIRQASHSNMVVAGSLAFRDGTKFVNRFYSAYPDGRLEYYDKKHLFTYGREDQHYSQGSARSMIEVKGWRIMPIICYDLRFPAWCRNTTEYDLMVVVANWPVPRIHHWDSLLQARAIENQCFITAVNRIGVDGNGLEYNGHSRVYDMNGQLLIDLKDESGIGNINLSKESLTTYRQQYQFLRDRDHFAM